PLLGCGGPSTFLGGGSGPWSGPRIGTSWNGKQSPSVSSGTRSQLWADCFQELRFGQRRTGNGEPNWSDHGRRRPRCVGTLGTLNTINLSIAGTIREGMVSSVPSVPRESSPTSSRVLSEVRLNLTASDSRAGDYGHRYSST